MLNRNHLSQFTGTEKWHRWSVLFPKVLLTDGARYVAENGGESGAYWLMDSIASRQPELLKNQNLRDFQLWELRVDTAAQTGVLTCRADSDEKPQIKQKIPHTDFDLPALRLYCAPAGDGKNQIILLPSEY